MRTQWPSDSDLHPAEASMMAAQQQQQYMDSKQNAYISFPHSEQAGIQGLPDPQQTELLHAMQNVTGRFIRNAVTQLRKRAAGLCIEELKEYKRAKTLSILEAPRQTQASHSRPASTSYLVPTVSQSHTIVDASQLSLPDLQHTAQDSPPTDAAQAQLALSKNELSRDASTQQQMSGSSLHVSHGIPASTSAQAPALLGSHMLDHGRSVLDAQDALTCLSNRANPSGVKSNQQLFDAASAAPSGDVELQCSSASISLDGSASDSQPSAGKQEVQLPSKQTAYSNSWCQSASQPLASGNGWLHVPSQPVTHFSPTKLACMPSFSFSKQPCPVMW